jgi:chromosome partitioning protein
MESRVHGNMHARFGGGCLENSVVEDARILSYNSTSGIGLSKGDISNNIYDVIINEVDIRDVIKPSIIENLDVCPGGISLAGAEVELVPLENRNIRLKNVLNSIVDDYKFILIDCPPSLGILTLNSLTAANSVIVPIQCEYYALEGVTELKSTIKRVQENLNKRLEMEGIVLTMYDGRTNLSVDVVDEVKRHFKEKVYETIIPRNVRLSEAPSYGLPIILHDSKSKGSECYRKLAKEVIENYREVN